MVMKLIKDKASAWETYRVADFPLWGIEKIDRGAWYAFRQWGGERVYLRQREGEYARGVSKAKATALLAEELESHKSRIIVTA